MDRATLLQIFQSRLERSDYSKLQKQGRTFYQEARRQASNTQARYIFVSSLFFFSVAQKKCMRRYRVYVCMFVCTYVFVRVYACVTCVFPFSMSSPSGFVSISRVFSVHVISVYTGSVVVVLVAVVSRFVTCRCMFSRVHLFYHFYSFVCPLCLFLVSSNFLSLHTTRDVPSIAVDLVAFHPNS